MTYLESALETGALWVYEDEVVALGHYCYSPMKKAGHVSLDSLQVCPTSQGVPRSPAVKSGSALPVGPRAAVSFTKQDGDSGERTDKDTADIAGCWGWRMWKW